MNFAIVTENHLTALQSIVSTLDRHNIQYQITGGLAGNIYGSTWPLHDIDIEVSQTDIERVAELFKKFIIRPLSRFIDEEFDLMLLTLRVNEIEIDIDRVEDAFVFTKAGTRIQLDANLSQAIAKNFMGLKISVQPLDDLIRYKELLGRKNDVSDLMRLK